MKKQVIIITDGDSHAKIEVEKAAKAIHGRCISLSAGTPSILNPELLIEMIKSALGNPVLVMVDDKGKRGYGLGEKTMMELLLNEYIEIIGIIAVASNCDNCSGTEVDCSVDRNGDIVPYAVNKEGVVQNSKILYGDTHNFLYMLKEKPYIIGIGDVGKMKGKFENNNSAVLTIAINNIINNLSKTPAY
ncbi:stage V sporulation protein AE [Clostridium cellulovorans]|uniref:Stage V sporulation protein AE n=1 Tax=Clostridium cellulovorans (strain ATCC 35296 / DSM 3052 / OCM 3 / 743B) TaxID=573061 RepID=D9SMX9_CLOC7|nr:stage V sporulation protein AE [Clostridium cellulovorans]ADL51845.1 stage V sporulation protein AE [Clostridium cellulovorans 743B]